MPDRSYHLSLPRPSTGRTPIEHDCLPPGEMQTRDDMLAYSQPRRTLSTLTNLWESEQKTQLGSNVYRALSARGNSVLLPRYPGKNNISQAQEQVPEQNDIELGEENEAAFLRSVALLPSSMGIPDCSLVVNKRPLRSERTDSSHQERVVVSRTQLGGFPVKDRMSAALGNNEVFDRPPSPEPISISRVRSVSSSYPSVGFKEADVGSQSPVSVTDRLSIFSGLSQYGKAILSLTDLRSSGSLPLRARSQSSRASTVHVVIDEATATALDECRVASKASLSPRTEDCGQHQVDGNRDSHGSVAPSPASSLQTDSTICSIQAVKPQRKGKSFYILASAEHARCLSRASSSSSTHNFVLAHLQTATTVTADSQLPEDLLTRAEPHARPPSRTSTIWERTKKANFIKGLKRKWKLKKWARRVCGCPRKQAVLPGARTDNAMVRARASLANLRGGLRARLVRPRRSITDLKECQGEDTTVGHESEETEICGSGQD
jgi:hypothetical protein